MLTNRSSLILGIAGSALVVALLAQNEMVALASLTLILWVGLQWLLFQWLLVSSRELLVNCQRTVGHSSDELLTLASGKEYLVQLRMQAPMLGRSFRFTVADTPPDACVVVAGSPMLQADLGLSRSMHCQYVIRPEACGKMVIPGIRVSVSDANGFFCREQLVPLRQLITVLPFMIRAQTTESVVKTKNLQRLMGHHLDRSSGVSAELLGIRDYRPGDPPKSIAWKPTARLGKLMSCEFESEVPIRSTIFVDLSSYQFVGRPGVANADRVVATSASIARLLLSDRDPVAAVVLTEHGSTRLPHGFGERQLTRVLQHLLAACDPSPRLEYLPTVKMVQAVFTNCYYRYPELFSPRINFGRIRATVFRPYRRDAARIRLRLALALCHLLDLAPGSEYRLQHDDVAMKKACKAYVAKFGITDVPVLAPVSLASERKRQRDATGIVCKRLIEARTRAKDNELFVVVGRAPCDDDQIHQVVDTVKVLVAAHHRVMFVDTETNDVYDKILASDARRVFNEHSLQLRENLEDRFNSSLLATGGTFGHLTDVKLMEKIATEIGLIRTGRSRGGTARSGRGGRGFVRNRAGV